ncbi:MAG: dTDP-4-dehydrorhamnose reductase [Acidobacteriota bacterium]
MEPQCRGLEDAALRALVFGGTGLLGTEVVRAARQRGAAALGLSSRQADLRDPQRLIDHVEAFRPDLVVNCAAFTAVDDCESREAEALAINGDAVAHAVAAARHLEAPLVQISTDYVFPGDDEGPYAPDAATGPRSAYGRTKLVGEQRALDYEHSLVLRISWVFGAAGANFVATMVRLMEGGAPELRVVDDQLGAPTYAPFAARAILDLASAGARGLYHYQNREPVTWYGFAQEIAREVAPQIPLHPVTTDAFPRPAPRPANSVLDVSATEALLGRPVETWRSGLAQYLAQRSR